MNKVMMVVDNFFDDLYLHELFETVKKIPAYGNNIANRSSWPYGNNGSHKLFGSTIFERETINNITILDDNAKSFLEILATLEEKILKQKVFLRNIQMNIQSFGMDGTSHMDSENHEDVTILHMVNPTWEKEWGGEFQILDRKENIEEEYEYKPGRLIVFPSNIPHRGLAPLDKKVIRYSIVYRISPLKNYI